MSISIYYLEMTTPAALNAKPQNPELAVVEAKITQPSLNAYLYKLVGEQWQWTDKANWSSAQWENYANDPNLRLFVAYVQGTPAGYFELYQIAQPETNAITVDIGYFGLASDFIGKGLGGDLLTRCIQTAWALPNTTRVTVNTCSLDHPGALANYQQRGMTIYSTQTKSS
uniref:GNAT family N-acetyltransferase n=1 Tax=Thaumasiovibrio occultus TaxID=1891184 RepID=UPI000B35D07C|nr:GNAT family N-acetyltransferase [Thaumasiovibrio occultus]